MENTKNPMSLATSGIESDGYSLPARHRAQVAAASAPFVPAVIVLAPGNQAWSPPRC